MPKRPIGASLRGVRPRVVLDVAGHCAVVEGRSVDLTPTELTVMQALVASKGRVLTRDTLLDSAWPEADVVDRRVDAIIMRLRTKLGAAAGGLTTVRGVGYRWDAL